MGNKKKKNVEEHFACPWCGKAVVFEAGNKIIVEAVPGETEKYVDIRKDTQTQLGTGAEKPVKKVQRKKW